MQLSDIPGKLTLPFADAGAKNTIPVASQIGITAGAASLTDGFPPLTRTPIASGGVPPSGADMNGILYEMSAVIRWANAGGGYTYDGTFAADSDVGGYPKGARVMRSDGLGYWLNTADNNVTDPEGAGAVAAGWVPDFTNGVAAVTMTGSNVTLTALEYGKPIIIISGLLTANLNLIFPDIAGQWIVINNTTGAFTITCKTAAGTGVEVAGVRAIVGDGTNIYGEADPLEISSTGQAQAGTDNTTAVSPLRLREAFNAAGDAPVFACRAWVNFNGTGVVAINASGNVSSVTDGGAGTYTVNFITAMPDVNYAFNLSARNAGDSTGTSALQANPQLSSAKTVSAFQFLTRTTTAADSPEISATFFR